MTDQLWIVEFSGRQTSGGFVQYRAPDRSEAPDKFWNTAGSLLEGSTVCQPPTHMGPSKPHPIWSLRPVWVTDQEKYWCFAVQGRGDDFTEAGTCQFAFVPFQRDPAEVWSTCVSRIGADGLLGSPPAHQTSAMTGPDVEKVTEMIVEGLLCGRRRVGVDGPPEAIARAIFRILSVFPVPVIAEYAWSSWLLSVPHDSELKAIAGLWPEEKRDKALNEPQQVDGWLKDNSWQPSVVGEDFDEERHAEVVNWLVEQALAATGPKDRPYPKVQTIEQLIAAVPRTRPTRRELALREQAFHEQALREQALRAQHEQVLRAQHAQVQRGLAQHDPAQLKFAQNELAQRVGQAQFSRDPKTKNAWIRNNPNGAISYICKRPNIKDYEREIVRELLEEMRRTKENVACVPPRPEPNVCSGWHKLLVQILREMYPTPELMAHFVEDYLTGPGLPLADPAVRAQADDWLRSLGLHGQPVRSPEHPAGTPGDGSGDQTTVIKVDQAAVAKDAQPMWSEPALARDMLIACVLAPQAGDAGALTAELMRVNNDSWDGAIDWLCELLDKLGEAQGEPLNWSARKAILEVGVVQLMERFGDSHRFPPRLISRWVGLQVRDPGLTVAQRMLINSNQHLVDASVGRFRLAALWLRRRVVKGITRRSRRRRHGSHGNHGGPAHTNKIHEPGPAKSTEPVGQGTVRNHRGKINSTGDWWSIFAIVSIALIPIVIVILVILNIGRYWFGAWN